MKTNTIAERLAPNLELLKNLLQDELMPESTVCQLCAVGVLSEWIISRDFRVDCPPSFILVNGGGAPDPCMQMVNAAFHGKLPERHAPPTASPSPTDFSLEQLSQMLSPEEREAFLRWNKPPEPFDDAKAIASIKAHIKIRASHDRNSKASGIPPEPTQAENYRQRNLRQLYGPLTVGFYARHARKDFGWGTDQSNRACLWITGSEDLARFRQDLGNADSLFWNPWGYDEYHRKCEKHLSILGTIGSCQWTSNLVTNVVEGSAPILFLPHVGGTSSAPIDQFEFNKILRLITGTRQLVSSKLPPPDPLSFSEAFRRCEVVLRYRLLHMPADYDFHIQRLVREVHTSFLLFQKGILMHCGEHQRKSWIVLLSRFFDRVIRGITMGVESLVYHGYGFEVGEHLPAARKMLQWLQTEGSRTRRDLSRRFQSIETGQRDHLVSIFIKEGLIRENEKLLVAVPCDEFLADLPFRPRMLQSR